MCIGGGLGRNYRRELRIFLSRHVHTVVITMVCPLVSADHGLGFLGAHAAFI
jgi:hypothetical protein